jgi:hypothetical protein
MLEGNDFFRSGNNFCMEVQWCLILLCHGSLWLANVSLRHILLADTQSNHIFIHLCTGNLKVKESNNMFSWIHFLAVNELLCLFFFFQYWGLNSGLWACEAGALLLEPHLYSFLLWLCWDRGSFSAQTGLDSYFIFPDRCWDDWLMPLSSAIGWGGSSFLPMLA